MKALKIFLLLASCFAAGKILNYVFTPSEVLYSSILFASPFVLMGFQQDLKTTRSSSSIFGKRFHIKVQTSMVSTFWGIPIGQPQDCESEDIWLPDTTPQELLEGVTSTVRVVAFEALKFKALVGS